MKFTGTLLFILWYEEFIAKLEINFISSGIVKSVTGL